MSEHPEATGSLAKDARVSHPDFGKGTVRGLVRGGRVARVEFDGMTGTPWEIPVHELHRADGSGVKPEPEPEPEPKPEPEPEPEPKPKPEPEAPDLDERRARQALEALRLGVVPAHHLETYTVGRDAELAVLRQDLSAPATGADVGAGGLRVLLGDYGTGKTHTLELIARIALEAGYLVGQATLDSRETLPSHPRRIYHQLARSLRYPGAPDRPAGLAPLLTEAAQDVNRVLRWAGRVAPGVAPVSEAGANAGGTTAHPYLGPALLYHAALVGEPGARDQALHERLLDWIEGAEVASNRDLARDLWLATGLRARLWALQDHRTVTHLYTLLLGGIACLAREVGHAGLVVLVDEAEFYSALRGPDRALSRVLFQTLAAASLPSSALRFDPATLPRGGHASHRKLPYRFRSDQPLHTVLALTHDPEGREMLEGMVHADRFLELRPFDTAAFVALSERVLALYQRARLVVAPGTDLAPLLATVMEACHRRGLIENPRQALKFITEVVDVTRLRPERVKPLLAELKQRFLAESQVP